MTVYCIGMNPTEDVIDPAVAAIMRRKSEAERLRIAWDLWQFASDMLGNLVRADHPEWTVPEVQREVARRMAHGRG